MSRIETLEREIDSVEFALDAGISVSDATMRKHKTNIAELEDLKWKESQKRALDSQRRVNKFLKQNGIKRKRSK